MTDLLQPGGQGDVPPADTKGMSSFVELRNEGFTPFILGPVYVYAGVGWDLVQRFYEEVGSKPVRDAKYVNAKGKLEVRNHKLSVRGVHLKFERPVVSHCPGWTNTVNVMDSDSFVHFRKWLTSQQFVNSKEKKFYVVRAYQAPLIDPLVLDLGGTVVPEIIDVFSVSGMKGMLVPKGRLTSKGQAKTFVEFDSKPPDEDVIKLGSVALKLVKES